MFGNGRSGAQDRGGPEPRGGHGQIGLMRVMGRPQAMSLRRGA